MPADTSIIQIVNTIASDHALDPSLVLAICEVESSFIAKSARYETKFSYLWKPEQFAINASAAAIETERQLQKFSWGMMQVMGATARWLGYQGFLPDLCDVKTGILYGCKYLHNLGREYPNMKDQIAAYNRGSVKRLENGDYTNQIYVNKVLRAMGAIDHRTHLS